MSARGKHAGRTTPTPGAAAAALRVTVHLDAAKRGVVIGAQGAAVKETQGHGRLSDCVDYQKLVQQRLLATAVMA